MSENKTKEVPKQEEVIINQYFNPNTKFELDMKQLSMLEAALAPFQWMFSIIADAKQEAAKKHGVKPAYQSDYKTDKDGNVITDAKGAPQLRDDFWNETKESNSLTITEEGEVETAKSN